MYTTKALSCLALLIAGGLASPAPALAPAATCADACYKRISQNRAAPTSIAKAGCTNFFQTTVLPCTVTSTVTNTVSTTVVAATRVDTSRATVVVATIDVEPSAFTKTVTSATLTTTVVDVETAAAARRELDERAPTLCTPRTISSTIVPSYFTASCANLAAYSSACSCFSVPHTIITRPTPTKFVTAKQVITVPATVTLSTTVTTTSTSVTTVLIPSAVSTQTIPVIATSICTNIIPPLATPSCRSVVNPDGLTYSYKAQATGLTYNTMNPGTQGERSNVGYFPGCYSPCGAIEFCVNSTALLAGPPASFDIYWLESESRWRCVRFAGPNSDPSYYNVVNNDVRVAYLYSE